MRLFAINRFDSSNIKPLFLNQKATITRDRTFQCNFNTGKPKVEDEESAGNK